MGRKRISTVKFQELVWAYYREHGRLALPWRKIRNPYKILVSEVMLQQTQVDRVIPKYREFLKAFPTVHVLADAPLSDVLRCWSGLGYNRRAMLLRSTAKMIVEAHDGTIPQTAEALQALPGVGPYTARAIVCFACNEPLVLIETNIRTVFLHHFFTSSTTLVPDRAILPFITAALDHNNPREWYYALMDYGAHLKKTIGNANRTSAHYARQSRFEGSRRQARGVIIKTLLTGPQTESELQAIIARPREEFVNILHSLVHEGSIYKTRGRYKLSS